MLNGYPPEYAKKRLKKKLLIYIIVKTV